MQCKSTQIHHFFCRHGGRQPCQVRPENPAEYSHDYMKQSQWVTGYQCWKLSGVFLTSPWCFLTETGQRIRGSCRYSPLVFWGRFGEVERNGLSALFRIPGILPSYDTDSGQDCRPVCHDVYWWLQLSALQWSTMSLFFSRLEQVNSRAYKSYNFIHSCAELKILLLCADRFL